MSSRPLTFAYAAFALLGAAVLGAFVYDRTRSARAPQPRPAAVAATVNMKPPTIPVRRPDFALTDLAGRRRPISEWDGRALVINFWATWCAPCRREIPLLNRIAHDYGPKGVEVIGIAVDFADDVRAFSKDFPIRYQLLIGEEDGLEAARAFGVQTMAFPFTAFTDSQGRMLALHMGELHRAEAEAILSVVARVDAGALTPVEARSEIEAALAALPRETTPHAGTG